MKDQKGKSRVPILAAGGVVLRNDLDRTPRLAVVQSRKLGMWGLPKGKLSAGEDAVTAACREVLEETGHRVTVHEFLGTLVYETAGRPKAIQFWRMEAAGAPAGALMRDVKAVDWLALDEAIDRLSHMRERLFLEQTGPIALRLAGRRARDIVFPVETAGMILVPDVPLAPDGLKERRHDEPNPAAQDVVYKSPAGKKFAKKTRGWLRSAALLLRQHFE